MAREQRQQIRTEADRIKTEGLLQEEYLIDKYGATFTAVLFDWPSGRPVMDDDTFCGCNVLYDSRGVHLNYRQDGEVTRVIPGWWLLLDTAGELVGVLSAISQSVLTIRGLRKASDDWTVEADPAPCVCPDCSAPVEAVDHPKHYNRHPSGVEAIDVCSRMGFSIGNAFKHLYRVGKKDKDKDKTVEDLRKALWYVDYEIARIKSIKYRKLLHLLRDRYSPEDTVKDLGWPDAVKVVACETRYGSLMSSALDRLCVADRIDYSEVPLESAAFYIRRIIVCAS